MQQSAVKRGDYLHAVALDTGEWIAEQGYRASFAELGQPGVGRRRQPGPSYRHAAAPWRILRPVPGIGQDNETVLIGELGLSQAEFRALVDAGVVQRSLSTVDYRAGWASAPPC